MEKMRIVILTGSYPPDLCGVGSYSAKLVSELKMRGLNISVYNRGPWTGFRSIRNLISILKTPHDLIHIQYPTVGNRTSLIPQLVAVFSRRCVVTLHEFGQVHPLRRLAMIPFGLFAKKLIFTNEIELQKASKWMPFISKKSAIVPVGSAIRSEPPSLSRTSQDVVYFGLIRPKKGIEDFIQAAKVASESGSKLQFRIVGTPDENSKTYFESLQQQAHNLPVTWNVNLGDNEVAEVLSNSKLAYMPFPDGASERRTSLLALLAQGIAVMSTYSELTPTDMRDVTIEAKTPEEAVSKATALLQNSDELIDKSLQGFKYVKGFSWDSIAEKHIAIYREALSKNI